MRIGKAHVIFRETLDWDRAGYSQLINPFIRETAALWDRHLPHTFTACRARIKAVSLAAHRELRNVRIHEGGSFDLDEIAAGDVVLFCDDDDWYSPHTVDYLGAVDELRDHLVVWLDGVFGFFAPKANITRPAGLPSVRLRHRALDHASGFLVKTNNYAVSGALLQSQPELLAAVWHHGYGGADECVRAGRVPLHVLPRTLSVVNRHPCSQLVLRRIMNGVGGEDAGLALWRLVRHYANSPDLPVPRGLEWAAPHMRQMKDLFRRRDNRIMGW